MEAFVVEQQLLFFVTVSLCLLTFGFNGGEGEKARISLDIFFPFSIFYGMIHS